MLIKKLALTYLVIRFTAARKPTSSASDCHYGQTNRYLVGLMVVGHKNDSRQQAISDVKGNFVQATPSKNYVIKVCDKQAVNYMYIYWLMAEYEYSVFQFGLYLGKGEGQNNIQYAEPYPHIYEIIISSKSHCPRHTFQQMHPNKTPRLCAHLHYTCIHVNAYTCKFTIIWYCCTLYDMLYTQTYYWFRRCARMLADLYTHNP